MTDGATANSDAGPFLFVHGAWHGAWCWYRIVSQLRGAGHEAVAIDLPGHGIDRTDRSTITLDSYAEAAIAALERFDRPANLVVHSMGGIVATAVAERRPDLLRSLTYVAAVLLPEGTTMLSYIEESGAPMEFADMQEEPNAENAIVLRPGKRRKVFYEESPCADVVLARMLLTPQPAGPVIVPTERSEKRFGSIPRSYVRCLRDRSVPIGLQDKMLSETPCRQVDSIDTDHSPFFSRPEELTAMLLRFATETVPA